MNATRLALAALAFSLFATLAHAQLATQVQGRQNGNGAQCLVGTDTTCQLPTSASVSVGSVAISGPVGTQTLGNSVAVTHCDGCDVTEGAKADAAWSGSGSGSLIAIAKYIGAGVNSPIPAGTALIGKVGIDQTTPGTTNNVTVSTNVGTLPLVQATNSVAVSTTTATALTQLIAASGSTKIYVTSYQLVFSGAGTFAWVTGTGANCGSNTLYLTGAASHPMSFAANGGISAGTGLGPIMITGAGGELCLITTGSIDISGSVSYAQF